MNNDNFDDIIKRKADSHQSPVPADAWDNINKKKKKKPFVIFWWSLSSLLILCIFVCIYSARNVKKILATNNSNTSVNSSSQPNKSNNNNNGTNSVVNDNVTATQTQSKNTTINNQLNKDVANEKSFTQNIKTNHSANDQPSQPKASSLITTKNSFTTQNYASIKKHKYSQQAKFKNTSVDAAIDAGSIDKTSNNPDDGNNVIDNKRNNNIKINDTQKIDSNKINLSVIATIQKKPPTDSSTKVKETDIGKTKTNSQNKTTINAGKKTKNPELILDFSATPFSPIQHYAQMLYLQRVGDHSTYTANAVQTSLQPSVAFTLNVKKNISKKIIIGTGIQYSHISENIKLAGEQTDTTFTAIQRLVINGAARFLGSDTIATTATGTRIINAVNSYRLFSIPLFINYAFINRPVFSLSFTAGVYFTLAQYNNSIDGKLQSVYSNGIEADNEKNKLATDVFAGIRLSWYVSKKYQLFTEPNFRYNLNKYELENSFINKNINQAGVSIGVSYKIK
jgi:hypothetical protein